MNLLNRLFHRARRFAAIEGTKPTLPVRGTVESAGYDFYLTKRVVIKPEHESEIIDLNVKCYLPKGEVLLLVPRSSITNNHLMLCNTIGVIDADYADNPKNEGNIKVKFFNYLPARTGGKTVVLEKGERVVQGLIVGYKVTDDDHVTAKRNGGMGSTGK